MTPRVRRTSHHHTAERVDRDVWLVFTKPCDDPRLGNRRDTSAHRWWPDPVTSGRVVLSRVE